MTKTKVWMLAILAITFALTSCGGDDPEPEVNEAELLIEYIEAGTDYGNGSLAIHTAEAVYTGLAAGKVYVIDIRAEADFDLGHIPGAHNVAASGVRAHIDGAELTGIDEISIVCYTGQTAAWLTSLLQLADYDNVKSMKFGMSAWHADFDKWSSNTSSEKSTFFVSEASPKGDAGDWPVLTTDEVEGMDIFEARYEAVLAEGFGAAAITNGDVYADLDGHYIINYWPEAEYTDPGHIDGAIQYTPSADLYSDAFLNTLPTDGTPVVVYCYTGQNSARTAAYLRILGYNAKSLKFGANSMIYDDMTKSKWSEAAIMGYDYDVTSK